MCEALARILAARLRRSSDVRKEHLVNALNGPLFGKWTREAVIFRHNRELDEKGREALYNSGSEGALEANREYVMLAYMCYR